MERVKKRRMKKRRKAELKQGKHCLERVVNIMGHYGSWGRLVISIIVSLAYQTRLFLAEPPPSLLF